MFYIFLTVLAGAIVALDQWTKWLTANSLAIGEDLPSILGIFHITHTKNTGAAWGILQGQRWLFLLVMVAFVVVIVIMFRKNWLKKKVEWLCLASILGGGLGNMIDRLFRGAVTDMICLDFVHFPVFNVADCFITVGAIGLIVYVLFFDREKPHEVEG